jgi:ligand-binding sensor domain-containing protein
LQSHPRHEDNPGGAADEFVLLRIGRRRDKRKDGASVGRRDGKRSGDIGKLTALGLRVASGESPFLVNGDLPRTAHQTVALALQYSAAASQSQFAEALKDTAWAPERAQLERRGRPVPAKSAGRDFGWLGEIPAGMRLLASNEDVLALASDSRNVYTGHSWGIAIYSRAGMPIGRVAVGFPVLSLAVSEGAIWAGGSTGLYRIEKESFRISRVASARLTGPIPALELAGDVLWIGGRNLARLNLKTRELHLFAAEELGIEHSWTD